MQKQNKDSGDCNVDFYENDASHSTVDVNIPMLHRRNLSG
jgi:hypothetical protein